MVQMIILTIVIALMSFLMLVIRSFAFMSISELKRQANKGNPYAKAVYPVRAYGIQLWILLWLVFGLLSSLAVILIESVAGYYWTPFITAPLIVLTHAILPWTRWPQPSLNLAAKVGPYLERMLRLLFPLLRRIETVLGKWLDPEPIKFIHSTDELVEILKHNTKDIEHVNKYELEIAENALVFGEKLVGDHMTPLNAVKFVNSEELLTPVVLGELHESGHSRFPVFEHTHDKIVGTLFLRDALRVKSPRHTKDVMSPDIYYINEHQTLDYALRSFLKLKHHIFIVVNEFEDVVGVVTIEDVVEQIIGKQIVDEFDQYEDLREVAKQTARKKHDSRETVSV